MCKWGPDEPNFENPKKWTNTGQDSASGDAGKDAFFWHGFDLLIIINISLAFIFIYSVQHTLNSTGNGEFQSSGTITITVGATNFTKLNTTSPVEITSITGTIKKYEDGQPKDFKSGITETLNAGTKLEIEAKGQISTITGSDVTIKGDVTVTNQGDLRNALTLTHNDHSSTGLSGTITPKDTDSKVTINGSSINLTGTALDALKSLTKNAVTLTNGSFRSSASITVTSSDVDFKTLNVGSSGLQITKISGTIKNADGSELQRSTPLTVGDKLTLDANGTITQPQTAKNTPVKLNGTIVVTSNDQEIGSTLTFGGDPNRSGVTGSLNLDNDRGRKYVKITGTDLKIDSGAYQAIQGAADTTSSSFTIGAADPRDPGSITGAPGLKDEECFTKYWHILPPNNYTDTKLHYLTSVSPALMVLLIATIFPPMIVVILQFTDKQSDAKHSPKAYGGWGTNNLQFWHIVNVLIVIKITLVTILIYSLHYRDSQLLIKIFCYQCSCHEADKAIGYLTLTPSNSGNYNSGGSTHTITLNISSATYKTGSAATEAQSLTLGGGTNTLVLTSGGDISKGGGPHTLTRKANSLTLNLKSADSNLTPGIYNVSLKIESNINLGSTITLKKTDNPVSLGTYRISGGGTNTNTTITGAPQENDMHSSHETTNCCMFGKQNTWSTDHPNNR
ncbi:uncharacterized protein TA04820 [Theileria annulata]|uniref:Uncharacterized protein n=1 Tax=Theileria annulata TaxID=5874 RepID=Q4UBU5_THEAN|nr:uncharacterized protein TA04820 [Theileria annulata]CAI75706.1 hypothetical protein, conserved [Theileria annulata]|eukprot:XP_955182.1 hypothetical protein, conserved [Theileria annulata]